MVGVVLLLAQPPLYSYAYNATHAPAQPAPAELHRLLDPSLRMDDTPDMRGMMHDLLVTVRYLAKRALESR